MSSISICDIYPIDSFDNITDKYAIHDKYYNTEKEKINIYEKNSKGR